MKYVLNRKTNEKSVVESSFEYIVECIESIYNDEETWEAADSTKKELIEFVDSLNTKQYQKVQTFLNTMPKLKHTFQVRNPKTKVMNDVTIEGLANFFA